MSRYENHKRNVSQPPENAGVPLLRIGLGSDWHIGACSQKDIRRCLLEMEGRHPDILVLPGDFNGGVYGAKAVRTIIKTTREVFPTIPILTTLGNHDHWVRGRKIKWGEPDGYKLVSISDFPFRTPGAEAFHRNYAEIVKTFKEFGVHFLDEDGLWRHKNYPGIVIAGHTLWYGNQHPPTNDRRYLPKNLDGDTNAYLYKKGITSIEGQLDKLTDADKVRIFVSHFPVMYPKGRTEMDEAMGGPERIGTMLWQNFNFRYFLNGHAHQHWEHFPRFESGSDYGKPNGIIVSVYGTEVTNEAGLQSPGPTPDKDGDATP